MGASFGIKFWGTRGLVSSPQEGVAVYGGNTSCLQVINKNYLIIIDTGFGVSNLGEVLMERIISGEIVEAHIFYTHYHWDHIQGLPFFHPIYFKNTKLNIYSPLSINLVKEHLDILFDGSYSPFAGIDSMPSNINYFCIDQGVSVGGFKVDFLPVDHGWKDVTYAYKFTDADGINLVVASDHEGRDSEINDKFVEFASGCNLLVHDAQYREDEYNLHEGWGHSSIKQALDNAVRIAPKKTLLTHHHPLRLDLEVDELTKEYSKKEEYLSIIFSFAKENILYKV